MLNALKVNFDLVLSSPLKRSVQTAQFVATETGYEAKIQLSEALCPEAAFPLFQQMLQQWEGRENVLVVGHSPNIQGFLGSLLQPPIPDSDLAARVPLVRLRKGSLARVVLGRGSNGSNSSTASASLSSLLDPRLVRALYATSTKRVLRKTSKK